MSQAVYRYISVGMAMIFALVGILFLFMSSGVVIFFNQVSVSIGMEQAEPCRENFFVILSVAYMYIVALLAFLMFRNPEEVVFPFLLFNAKAASSVISILLFVIDGHLLIYITNGIVDGTIGLLVIVMYRSVKGKMASTPFRKRFG
jgi:hypothetical protein